MTRKPISSPPRSLKNNPRPETTRTASASPARFLDFLKRNLTRNRPVDLQNALQKGDASALWTIWRERIDQNVRHLRLEEIAVPPREDFSPSPSETLPEPRQTLRTVYEEMIAPCHALNRLSPDEWIERVEETEATLSEAFATGIGREDPLSSQILGEIALLFSAIYPDLRSATRFRKEAKRRMIDGILETLDSDGLPATEDFPIFRPLLASLTRSQIIAERSGIPLLPKTVAKRWEKGILQALRWRRPDGSVPFAPSPLSKKEGKGAENRLFRMIANAIPLVSAPAIRSTLTEATESGKNPLHVANPSGRKGVEPAFFNISSSLAAFRSSWKKEDSPLFVKVPKPDGNPPTFQLESFQMGRKLLNGAWEAKIWRNGVPLSPAGEWRLNVEEADESRIYWELGLPLTGDRYLERHLLSVPDAKILLLADSIVPLSRQTPDPSDQETDLIVYEGSWKLSDEIAPLPDPEGNEILLNAPKGDGLRSVRSFREIPLARVLPIGLPEWREHLEADDRFDAKKGWLTLRQSAKNTLFAPILFDLDPKRLGKRYTWRKLTVGEKMERVADSIAVGFRIHLHADQFLLYRSLNGFGCRSVWGAHLDQEFFFGRFLPNAMAGDLEPLVEVEAE